MRGRVAAVVAGSVVAVLVAPWIGPALAPEHAEFVLWQLRVPRVALGVLVGGSLGLTGAAFQAVLENPLATPSTIGTTAGAGLGALTVLVLGGPVGAGWVGLGAFVGAALVSLLVASLASTQRFRMEDLLLAGIAIGVGASALSMGLQLQADASVTLAAVRWSLGSLATVGPARPLLVLPFVLVGAVGVLTQLRALQALVAGHERAATQGVDVRRVRTIVLGVGSLAVGGCVAACGPIAFVGLVVPHLVRLWVGGGPRRVVPLSAVVGAGFLPLADGLARVLLPGQDLPVGVLTALLGAPTLIWLLWTRR
jgi:iron complex transport system permease protein